MSGLFQDTLDLAVQAVPPGPPSSGNARFYVQGGTIFLQAAPPQNTTRYSVLVADSGGTLVPRALSVAGTLTAGGLNAGTLVVTPGAPASSTAVGVVGQLRTDGTFLYYASGTATWLRMGSFGTF